MDRKQHIISTYLKLGAENGFQNVSLSDIATIEKINKASLFSHFSSYNDLKTCAENYCLDYLNKHSSEISVDFSSSDSRELFSKLIVSFIKVFSSEEMYCFLNMICQLKTISENHMTYYETVEKMITARFTVAFDFCVQRSWSNMNNTDDIAKLITPFVIHILTDGVSDDETDSFIDSVLSLL